MTNERELEVLAKVEQLNRELLADEKAVYSLNSCIRKASCSNSLSGDSSIDGSKGNATSLSIPSLLSWTTGNNIPSSAPLSDQWAHVIENWDQFAKKRSVITGLVHKGLPDRFRPLVWRLITGAYDCTLSKTYEDYLGIESPFDRAIRRDVARTFPKHDMFKDADGYGQQSLYRLIKAYSVHDREVGYCQGSGFIAGLLLMQLPEGDAFTVFVQLMDKYGLRELYKPSMLELGVCIYQLERLLAIHLPELHTHFIAHSISPTLYASAWFLTLFSTILPISMATRVMDLFMVEGFIFVFRMALAVLQFSADKLVTADMESIVVFLQNDGPAQWERHAQHIFQSAQSFRLSSRQMRKFQKEYLQIRSQEREEQLELRRLRTENGLLLQRVAKLDEECSSMANRLVQSQMIRAQESEAMLMLRCQLSILRRSNADTASASTAPSNGQYPFNHAVKLNYSETAASLPFSAVLKSHPSIEDRVVANGCETQECSNADEDESTGRTCQPHSPSLRDVPQTVPAEDGTSEHRAEVTVNQAYPSSLTFLTPCSTWSKLQRECSIAESDSLMLTTLHRLQSDLASCRAREADAKLNLLDLKTKYSELEQLKTDLEAQTSDRIAVLQDELLVTKLRETEALEHVERMRTNLRQFETLWQTHLMQCKHVQPDGKRLPFLSDSSKNHAGSSDVQKMWDSLLEAHLTDRIADLKHQLSELSAQKMLSDHRADRLDRQLHELLEARALADATERGLRLELKQTLQMCADTESKRKADSIMWRSQVMELTAQLTEMRQSQLQLEYKYDSLLTAESLEVVPPSDQSDVHPINDNRVPQPNSSDFPSPESAILSEPNSSEPYSDLLTSVPEAEDPPTPEASGSSRSNDSLFSHRLDSTSSGLISVWKDLPPTVMTDSIGPLEDLCLVPDDPLITSVYLNSDNKNDL